MAKETALIPANQLLNAQKKASKQHILSIFETENLKFVKKNSRFRIADSKTLLYYSDHAIWSESIETGEVIRFFATDKIISGKPSITPNGEGLLFPLYSNGLVDVVYYEIEQGQTTNILHYDPNDYGYRSGEFPTGSQFYEWSPDGQWGIFGLSVYDDTWTFIYASELFLFHVQTKQVYPLMQLPLSFPPEFIEWVE